MALLTNDVVIGILLYTYALGMFLNGVILFASLIDRKKLLKTRMDQITFALILVSFIWSTGRTVIQTLQGLGTITQANQGSARFSNMCLVFIFFLNGNLAMERYFQIKEHPYAKQLYVLLYVSLAMVAGTMFWAFWTSPSITGISPIDVNQRLAWAICIFLTFCGTTLVMVWCYARTYKFSARQFKENPMMLSFFMKAGEEAQDPETLGLIRIRLERQILMKCILLSMSLVVCYLPLFVYSMLLWYNGFDQRTPWDPDHQFFFCGAILLAIDMVISPLLVLYFKPELRETVFFWKN